MSSFRSLIAKVLEERISTGIWQVGQRIYSNELAQEFGVGPSTIHAALCDLQQKGLVYPSKRRDKVGWYVGDAEDQPHNLKTEIAMQLAERIWEQQDGYQHGQPLSRKKIREEFDCSQTTVDEALYQLGKIGLLVQTCIIRFKS